MAEAWKSPSLVKKYLEGVRGAIPFAAEQVDVALRILEAGGRPVESFLDLGCGDGVLAAALFDRYPRAAGALLDFSEPMLDAARERFRNSDRRARFILADYGDPAWTSQVRDAAPFDAIISGFSIHHQPDEKKRRIYGELYGLLAAGGFFINIEHVSSPTRWLETLWEEHFIDAMHARNRAIGAEKTREQTREEFHRREDGPANILAPVELQCEWLRSIGFEEVDCYLKIFELAVFGGRRPA